MGSEAVRIAEARVERRLLRYHSPIVTAHGTLEDRWTVLLTLVDEDGNVGMGEAAPLAGFTSDTVEAAESALLGWAADETDDGDPPASVTARAAHTSPFASTARSTMWGQERPTASGSSPWSSTSRRNDRPPPPRPGEP